MFTAVIGDLKLLVLAYVYSTPDARKRQLRSRRKVNSAAIKKILASVTGHSCLSTSHVACCGSKEACRVQYLHCLHTLLGWMME